MKFTPEVTLEERDILVVCPLHIAVVAGEKRTFGLGLTVTVVDSGSPGQSFAVGVIV